MPKKVKAGVKPQGDAAKNPPHRPSGYSQEIADTICSDLAAGLSLREIAAKDGMPSRDTMRRWLGQFPEFQAHYARARELQMEHYAEEILDISDDASADVSIGSDGIKRVDNEAIQRSRLRVDTRKWLMSKLAAKKYGDKLTAELGGIGGGAIKFESMTDAELREQLAKDLALLQLPRE